MATWTRDNFEGVGLTQCPPGKYLPLLQSRHGGVALLCLDVSSSMTGRLGEAVEGARRFLREAEQAHYRCGLILWNHGVAMQLVIGTPHAEIVLALDGASARGGTRLLPALRAAEGDIVPYDTDRVLCIFGDGDIGEPEEPVRLARELCARGVRIVVRGLGQGATDALAPLQCPNTAPPRVIKDVRSLASGIADMARSFTTDRSTGR
ncbi:VWA domain-containing protein [Actinokineospora enzanensis]|uniref:VWA domain-containing protein n=1 Tax=Actinokineospora enzanensis TaxID=155975 RepID=UPI000370FECE